jgi:hypothetical protein
MLIAPTFVPVFGGVVVVAGFAAEEGAVGRGAAEPDGVAALPV